MATITASSISCGVNKAENSTNQQISDTQSIEITINEKTLSAKLFDNETAETFKEMLPQTFEMTELNGNEK